jgi:hypothetical protein
VQKYVAEEKMKIWRAANKEILPEKKIGNIVKNTT